MTHLTPDELIDAVEGTARGRAAGAPRHVRRSASASSPSLSSVLSDAKQVSVPEPSPLFWQHFSERVRAAIDHDAAPASNWPAWLRWQVLAAARRGGDGRPRRWRSTVPHSRG